MNEKDLDLADAISYSLFASQLYMNNKPVIKLPIKVKQVIVQPDKKVVVVIFENGDKSIAKCGKDDTFSIENGVAIAISKYVLGSGSEFKRLVKNATIQEVKKEVKTFINNSIGEVPTHCNALESDKIEVGDTVKIIDCDIPPRIFAKSELGKIGKVKDIDEVGDYLVETEYTKNNYNGEYWNVNPKGLKLIKKGVKK